jgi:hypothetical protein
VRSSALSVIALSVTPAPSVIPDCGVPVIVLSSRRRASEITVFGV